MVVSNKKARKRVRCLICGHRVNLNYDFKKGMVYMACPKCGSHGSWKDKEVTTKKSKTIVL